MLLAAEFDKSMALDSISVTRAFAVLSISLFASMLGLGIVSPLMSIFAEDLGATGVWLGAIFSGYFLARALIMPFIGRLSDQWGKRKIFLALGLATLGFTSIGYILSRDVIQLMLARFLQGLGSGIVLPISLAYIGDITPDGKEGSYIGYINMARMAGWGSGPLVGGILMEWYGFEMPFLIMGALAFLALVIVLVLLPEKEVQEPSHTQPRPTLSYRTILNIPAIRGVVVFRVITAIGTGNLFSFFPLLADSLGIPPGDVGILLSSRVLIMSFLQGPFGILADRYDKTRLILLSGIGSAILMLLVPSTHTFWELLTLGIFIGLNWAILIPASTGLAAEYGREHGMASVMSTINVGMSIGMVIGPLTSGLIMDLFNIQAIFYYGGLMAILGSLLFFILVIWRFRTTKHSSTPVLS
jgi:MFS family permease